MELVLAKSQDALVLTSISKRAFDSDIEVGGAQPGYLLLRNIFAKVWVLS